MLASTEEGTIPVAQLLKLFGFWPPLVYGFAVFSLFWMLDRQAAPRARKAITIWFSGKSYDKSEIASAIVSVFDRLYTRPLLRLGAFFRSASISLIVAFLFAVQQEGVSGLILLFSGSLLPGLCTVNSSQTF
jgi:hypothetical protein